MLFGWRGGAKRLVVPGHNSGKSESEVLVTGTMQGPVTSHPVLRRQGRTWYVGVAGGPSLNGPSAKPKNKASSLKHPVSATR